MKKSFSAALLMAVAILFLLLNRAAYQGYFSDDELDNIVNTRDISSPAWVAWFATPRLDSYNFRPAGHFYFYAMNRVAHLDFPKYIASLHALHLLNVFLLWLLLRRLCLGVGAALAGAAFFALNVSAFDAYWKPMYVFDVLCATFCLATLLLYERGQWVAALGTMWLAYKSKELAVMLPLVLTAYEYWFGPRRWFRLAPFFAISLCFGAQALMSPKPEGHPYAFVLTADALRRTATYYSSRIFLLPFAGLVVLGLPLAVRDRRMWLGAMISLALVAPLLFLPGRMFSAYTYLPLAGVAIELSVLAAMVPPIAVVGLFALWLPWNILELRADRKATLAADDQVRAYAGSLLDFGSRHPNPPAIAISSAPDSFHVWGVRAAILYPYSAQQNIPNLITEAAARALPADSPVVFVSWDRGHNAVRILSRGPALPDSTYLKMGPETPIWQLGDGWFGAENDFRWTEPHATAHLAWPPGASQFEAILYVIPAILGTNGHLDVTLEINGLSLGKRRIGQTGIQSPRWELPPRPGESATVEFTFEPAGHFPSDPRTLGAPVVAFGFVPTDSGH